MRLRSQEPSVSTNTISPSVASGQSSTGSGSTTQKVTTRPARSFFRKYHRILRIFLFLAALGTTSLELKLFMPRVHQWYLRQGCFIYMDAPPSAATYSPNSRYLAVSLPITRKINETGAEVIGSRVDLYDGRTGTLLNSVYKGDVRFDNVSFSKSENRLYLHSAIENSIYTYDVSSKKLLQVPTWTKPVFSELNPYANSVIRIYKDRLSIQSLDTGKTSQLAFSPIDNLNQVTNVTYSKDQRFIGWIDYTLKPNEKTLRLADLKEKRVVAIESGRAYSVSGGRWSKHPIVLSPTGKSIYISGYVYKPIGYNDFLYGIAEVDLASGKVLRSRSEMPGISVSHVAGNTVYIKNTLQDTEPLHWEIPSNLLTTMNVLTTSPDKRWNLIYYRHGIMRRPVTK